MHRPHRARRLPAPHSPSLPPSPPSPPSPSRFAPVLGQARDPQAVQPHVRKCFEVRARAPQGVARMRPETRVAARRVWLSPLTPLWTALDSRRRRRRRLSGHQVARHARGRQGGAARARGDRPQVARGRVCAARGLSQGDVRGRGRSVAAGGRDGHVRDVSKGHVPGTLPTTSNPRTTRHQRTAVQCSASIWAEPGCAERRC